MTNSNQCRSSNTGHGVYGIPIAVYAFADVGAYFARERTRARVSVSMSVASFCVNCICFEAICAILWRIWYMYMHSAG